jgi:hypothetical protein
VSRRRITHQSRGRERQKERDGSISEKIIETGLQWLKNCAGQLTVKGCWLEKTKNEGQATVKECEFRLISVKCEIDVKKVSSNN